MNSNRFYSVPYDGHRRTDILLLSEYCGGSVVATYGRWHVLLGWLYDCGGVVDIGNEVIHNRLLKELELSTEDFAIFCEKLADLGMVDAGLLHRKNHLVSRGVCDQIAFRKNQVEKGKRNGKAAAEKPTVKATG